ncbi:MAG: hypothetical protein IIA45_08515, partial [Bacteroidetes bacterium]|nr:hypothetical protein [Bacteroidota bacterium]
MIFIRKILPAAAILMLFSIFSNGQSTWQKVYTLMQTNCALTSCHSNGSAIASLDLEGSGASAMSDVYNSLIGVIPTNSFAAGKGYKRIYTGDPHRSFLFRKVNQSLDSDLTLELNE